MLPQQEDFATLQLPPLRENLELLPGASTAHGSPTFTIHDKLAGKFYRIGWLEFEILARWELGTPEKILHDVKRKPFLQAEESDIKDLLGFLQMNHLIGFKTEGGGMPPSPPKPGIISWLLKNYLYLRVPLVRPDAFLKKMVEHTRWLFTPFFFIALTVLALIGVFLVSHEWSNWLSEFGILKTPGGIFLGSIVLLFAKAIHELGHGLVTRYYGCAVPRMGVALILLFPVLWTDTTQAWKLTDRRQRLLIDSGGVLAELALAAIATILWVITPEGTLKSALHLLSGVTWIMTLAVNVNPFMRFDGYYILADALDTPNLQERAFNHTKWLMRRVILGAQSPPPEFWSRKMEVFLVIYSVACWIYRLVLFLGIAFLVYHFAFKALGILLFVIEIWYFILRPIHKELTVWFKETKGKAFTANLSRSITIASIIALFFILPVHRSVQAPGYLRASQEYLLEAPRAAQLTKMLVKNDQLVKRGDPLYTLSSPDIESRLEQSRSLLTALQRQYQQSALGNQTYERANLLREKIGEQQAQIASSLATLQRMQGVALVDGRVTDIQPDMLEGVWLEAREPIGILVSKGIRLEAFVTERDLDRLRVGQTARVSASAQPQIKGMNFVISSIDQSPLTNLPYLELSAQHGGQVRMLPASTPNSHPRPADQLFRVVLTAEEGNNTDFVLNRAAPVDVIIDGRFYSPALVYLKRALSIVIRESGL